jgi:exodeoxyribonuclease V alpha subunit
MTRESEGSIVVEGEIERITFENVETGFRVMKLAVEGRSDRLAVVGSFQAVRPGMRVRVRGTMVKDAKWGDQLRAAGVTELSPNTLVGLERYLGSGLIKGIGQGFASRIVAAFGLDALKVLDEAPQRLAEVEGLGGKRARAIGEAWKEQRALRDVMVFLQAHGASVALAARIYKRYGPDAVNVVSRDPYRLAIDVWGIGFHTADRLAQELGVAKDSPARMQAGVLQVLRDATEAGHSYAEHEDVASRAAALLEVDSRVSLRGCSRSRARPRRRFRGPPRRSPPSKSGPPCTSPPSSGARWRWPRARRSSS